MLSPWSSPLVTAVCHLASPTHAPELSRCPLILPVLIARKWCCSRARCLGGLCKAERQSTWHGTMSAWRGFQD